jgi:hypothetical protein
LFLRKAILLVRSWTGPPCGILPRETSTVLAKRHQPQKRLILDGQISF